MILTNCYTMFYQKQSKNKEKRQIPQDFFQMYCCLAIFAMMNHRKSGFHWMLMMLSFFKAEIENYFLKYQQTVVINEMHSPLPPRKCCCIWLQCQKWLCPIPHTMKSIIILAIINVVICPSVNGLSSTRRRGGGGLDAVHTDILHRHLSVIQSICEFGIFVLY